MEKIRPELSDLLQTLISGHAVIEMGEINATITALNAAHQVGLTAALLTRDGMEDQINRKCEKTGCGKPLFVGTPNAKGYQFWECPTHQKGWQTGISVPWRS